MWVGGEFYDDERWQLDAPALDTSGTIFLNGGKACLIIIAEYLRAQGIERILLPAYLCPTIVDTLESRGLRCDYYPIRSDLTIDLPGLAQSVDDYKAVLFINYFGFQHNEETRAYLARLRQRGMIVVEDNAQAGFAAQTTGDFVFNSMRKLAPYDGAYLATTHDVSELIGAYPPVQNRRLPLIRRYRRDLAEYRYRGSGSYEELSRLYEQAERYYALDPVVQGDAVERAGIEHLDWAVIKQARRDNYMYLLDMLTQIPGVTPIFTALQPDNMPLFLPVYIEKGKRDRVFDMMGGAGVGLTIHWDAIPADPRLNTNAVAVDMAQRMLSLVIDQRHSRKQLEYQAEQLFTILRK